MSFDPPSARSSCGFSAARPWLRIQTLKRFDGRFVLGVKNDLRLNKSHPDLRVNLLEYWQAPPKGLLRFSWVTDILIRRENAVTLMRIGRARRRIENETFNTLKNQGYHLEHNDGLGQKRLIVVMMALTAAFQTWMDQQDKLAQQGQETGIRKFREKVRQENGNKLIVFEGDRYAIFDAYEVFILCGINVRMPTGVPEAISKADILLKYGALRE